MIAFLLNPIAQWLGISVIGVLLLIIIIILIFKD